MRNTARLHSPLGTPARFCVPIGGNNVTDHNIKALPYVGEPEFADAPCFVRHPDAGGQCERPATMTVYGLGFCAPHGEDAKLQALEEAYHDAREFFRRFLCGETEPLSAVINRELGILLARPYEWDAGVSHERALRRAYPNAPEPVRSMVELWESNQRPGYAPVVDRLYDSLNTLHKLMRIAYEDRETWLVEVLELEREGVAAQAAYALRDLGERATGACGLRPAE